MFNEPLLVVVRKPSWTLHKPLLQYALVVGFTLGDCCWFTWPGWIDSRFHGECTGRGGLTVDYIVDPVFQRGILFIFQYHSECLKLCAVMTGGSCGVSLFTPSPLFSQSWPKSSAHIIGRLVWKTTPVSPLRCWRQAHLCGEAECLLQVKHRETIKRQWAGVYLDAGGKGPQDHGILPEPAIFVCGGCWNSEPRPVIEFMFLMRVACHS